MGLKFRNNSIFMCSALKAATEAKTVKLKKFSNLIQKIKFISSKKFEIYF